MERAWTYLEDRFGVLEDAAVLQGVTLKEVSDDIWLTTTDNDTPMSVKTYGIRFIRVQDVGFKPTTYALQFLDGAIDRNMVELELEQLQTLLDGEMIPEEQVSGTLEEDGYVAIRYAGRVVGCGLYKNGKVSSRIPKGRGKELADALQEKKSGE